MKKLEELRYPTEEELKEALEASENGPEAVLEFLRNAGAPKSQDSGDGCEEDKPGTENCE